VSLIRLRLFRLLLLCALCPKLMTATAIVAAIFPEAIYIAADSRLTKTANGGPVTSSDGCKIVQTPVGAFAVAALSSDSKTGFDFSVIAKEALVASIGPLSARVDAVDHALAPKMKRTVAAIKLEFPDLYQVFKMGHLGQAVFAGWESGHPVLIEDDWKITPEGDISEERFPASDEMNLVILGSGGDAILRYVDRNPDWWMSPTAEALEKLILAAIQDAEATHTADVGGDVSVLMIDQHGQRWVNPGKCSDSTQDRPKSR
jgi:hypothetical protein